MTSIDRVAHGQRFLRWAEFVVLFLGIPLVLALLLPPSAMYPILTLGGLAGLALLHVTPGFAWRDLVGPVRLGPVVGVGVLTFVVASALCWVLLPDRLWGLLRMEPAILLMITALYPPLLVLPQEIVFRPLFFCRYGALFPESARIWVNAGVFSLAHLMYWHWAVLLLTFIGSVIFTQAYLQPRGFCQAVALHAVAGIAIFASGLGWLFYSGGHVASGG